MTPLIKVKNLSAFYENREVFKNLSFEVLHGDYLCVVGENGSGKTTLMRLLLGMQVKHSGEISLNSITRRDIGWLPQKTQSQRDFPASVMEVIMSGFAGKHFLGLGCGAHHRSIARDNMRLLDIEALRDKPFSELSGGEAQKVLLCRAMCAANKVLLLDEPANSLDSFSQKELYALIKRLNQRGMTIIMISHDIERAAIEAKHILSLSDNGFFFGTSEQFLQQSRGNE